MADMEGRIAYANSAMCRIFDVRRPDEIVGRNVTDFYDDAFINRLATDISIRVLNEGEWTGEMQVKTAHGRLIPSIINIFLIRDRDNRPLYFASVLTDISERKRAEEALRESEAKYRELIQNSNSIIIRMTSSGEISFMNDYALRYFGYGEDEIVGRNVIGSLIEPGSAAEDFFHKMITGIAANPENYLSAETENILKSGSPVWVSWNNKALSDENGKIIGIFSIGSDVTERRQLEDQLRQAQKMESIGTLAGGIAHDFNNILSPIIGFTEMTIDQLPADSRARSNLEKVLKAADRAKDMVKHILTFSRQGEQEHKPVEIQYILKEALKLLRATLPATIDIQQEIDDHCGPVLADPTQVHQVLMNLCTNAYHAMQDHGGILKVGLKEVTIAEEDRDMFLELRPGAYVRLEVSDTGCGMDESVRQRIFDPYFTTKAPDRGTGMGLAVVHGIVKSHDGQIIVDSEPGKGASFYVYLPRIAAYDKQVEEVRLPLYPRGRERILLVDDEMHIVEMMQQMLGMLGYEVTTRLSSAEALELFRGDPQAFDLVITDQTMPAMTGEELTREIMAVRPDIPVILCTGFSENFTEEAARQLGIREYIMKPVDMNIISHGVRRALDG